MPLMRYFLFVGGVLLTLLFVVGGAFPTLPVVDRTDDAVDLPVIRIHSDRKWPERVVFDTRVPAAVAAPAVTTEAQIAVPVADSGVSAKARVLDAFAQLQPPEPKQLEPNGPGKPEPKPRPKRKVAKTVRSPAPPMIQVAQQPRFGFFGNNTW
jgi:hypothetical protein